MNNTLLGALTLLCCIDPAFATPGCIVEWDLKKPYLVLTDMMTFKNKPFSNDLVEVTPAPENIDSPSAENFCYPMSDNRLAYISAYHRATTTIAHYNELFRKLGLKPLPRITINIKPIDMSMPFDDDSGWANPEKNSVPVLFRTPAIDQSLVFHEIGHVIH